MSRGLGRLPAPDARDLAYPMRAVIPVAPLRLMRFWNDLGWWGDQLDTPQCVAYAWLHLVEDGPITQPGITPVILPRELYDAAQQNDEWPGPPPPYDGTSVRAGAKVLQAKGYITEYRWAFDVQTAIEALLNVGPVVVGCNWYSGMDDPDPNDIIHATGVVRGGHAFVLNGVTLKRGLVRMKNSWGRRWGGDGRAWMEIETFERLLSEDGECALATERRVAA